MICLFLIKYQSLCCKNQIQDNAGKTSKDNNQLAKDIIDNSPHCFVVINERGNTDAIFRIRRDAS